MWHEAQRPRGDALRDGWCCKDATGRKCASASRGLQECSSVHDLPHDCVESDFPRCLTTTANAVSATLWNVCPPWAPRRLPNSRDFDTSHCQHPILILAHALAHAPSEPDS